MSGALYDDPNREAVGLEPAWVEGTGGTPGEVTPTDTSGGGGGELDEMTKADLLQLAKDRDISPANNDMTKQELIDAIRGQGTG